MMVSRIMVMKTQKIASILMILKLRRYLAGKGATTVTVACVNHPWSALKITITIIIHFHQSVLTLKCLPHHHSRNIFWTTR